MTQVIYNIFKSRMADGSTTWDGGDIRALVLDTTATGADDPDLDTVSALLAVTNVVEASGGNYSRQALTGKTVILDDANDMARLDADNLGWSSANWGGIDAIVLYEEGGGTDATRYLVSYHDGGLPQTTPNHTFNYKWEGGGTAAVLHLA